jgi:predicted NUDIX family NTP pyrophosphohydrolase
MEHLGSDLEPDQAEKGAGPFDRLARLVNCVPKYLLAVVEAGGRPIDLVDPETLETCPQWLSGQQAKRGKWENHAIGKTIRGLDHSHQASVMSDLLRSAGLLPFRRTSGIELLVAHPGGPYFARRDNGWWSIVKGIVEPNESDLEAAAREFSEETGWDPPPQPWIHLGETTLKSRKVVIAYAVETDFDPDVLDPGMFLMGGRSFPEIDRVEWMKPELALTKLNPAQSVFVERLLDHVAIGGNNPR